MSVCLLILTTAIFYFCIPSVQAAACLTTVRGAITAPGRRKTIFTSTANTVPSADRAGREETVSVGVITKVLY